MDTVKVHIFKLLKWSEKYTKTDMVYLMSGGFWLVGGQMISSLINFFVTVAFGYFLAKSDYGNYKYVLSVFALLSVFTLTGLNTAIIQSVAKGFEGSLRQGVRLGMRWSFFAVSASLIGAGYYFFRNNTFLGYALLLMALTFPFLHSWGFFSSYLNGKKEFVRLSLYSTLNNTIPPLLIVGAMLITKNVLILLAVFFISNALLDLLFYLLTLRHYQPETPEDPELKGYAFKLSALNIVNLLALQIDKIIVFTTLGAVELAVYGFATSFPDQIKSLLKNLSTLMIPKFTENNTKKLQMDLRHKIALLTLLVVGVTLIYMLVAPLLYSLFFPKYPESVYFSRILALSILSSIAMIPLSLFIAEKKEDKLAKATISGSILQILVLLPAAHLWGLTGVAISRVLSSYMTTGVAYYLIRHRLKKETSKTS